MSKSMEPSHWGLDHPSQPLSQNLIQGVETALKSGMTHYVDVPGIPELRAQVANHKSSQVLKIVSDQVLITAGIQEARFLSLQSLTADKNPVAIPKVVHPGVRGALGVRKLETQSLEVEEDRSLLTETSIEHLLDQEIPLLFLENPSRFSGATYTSDELDKITQFVNAGVTNVIWDEGLGVWNSNFNSVLTYVKNLERTTVIGEIKPGRGIENLQLGYVIASKEKVMAMTALKQIMSICTSTPSQLAAIELFNDESGSERLYETLKQIREQLVFELTKRNIPVLQGESVNTIAFGAAMTSLSDTPLFSRGEIFGCQGFTRVSIPANLDVDSILNELAPTGVN